jgi:GTPase
VSLENFSNFSLSTNTGFRLQSTPDSESAASAASAASFQEMLSTSSTCAVQQNTTDQTTLSGSSGKEARASSALVARADVRVCLVGDTEVGKSTLVGVLTRGKLDNGQV